MPQSFCFYLCAGCCPGRLTRAPCLSSSILYWLVSFSLTFYSLPSSTSICGAPPSFTPARAPLPPPGLVSPQSLARFFATTDLVHSLECILNLVHAHFNVLYYRPFRAFILHILALFHALIEFNSVVEFVLTVFTVVCAILSPVRFSLSDPSIFHNGMTATPSAFCSFVLRHKGPALLTFLGGTCLPHASWCLTLCAFPPWLEKFGLHMSSCEFTHLPVTCLGSFATRPSYLFLDRVRTGVGCSVGYCIFIVRT